MWNVIVVFITSPRSWCYMHTHGDICSDIPHCSWTAPSFLVASTWGRQRDNICRSGKTNSCRCFPMWGSGVPTAGVEIWGLVHTNADISPCLFILNPVYVSTCFHNQATTGLPGQKVAIRSTSTTCLIPKKSILSLSSNSTPLYQKWLKTTKQQEPNITLFPYIS